MSVNEMAMQSVWKHHFLLQGTLSELGETVARIWPQSGNNSALGTLQNYIFLKAPTPVTHIWHTFPEFFILLA